MEKQLLFKRTIIFVTMLLLPTAHFAQNASFQGLGHIYDGFLGYQSEAHGVSYDGTVVVGVSSSIYNGGDVWEAFRWTETEGMQGIGTITESNFFSYARGVSADGSVIVGYSRSELASVWEAFRWTEAEGMIGLGDLVSNDLWSESKDVSADGSVVTGRSYVTNEGFRWENGQMENITEEGAMFSEAWGISGNGEVIVGTFFDGNTQQGFRWTESGGLQSIGSAPGENYVLAYKTSYDGTVIVGGMGTPQGREAFLWTEDSGIVGIGNFPGNFYSEANDVSDNGEIIIGIASHSDEMQAFIWTESEGMQNLKEVLEDNHDLNLAGWTLTSATAISGDGSTIVGYGINPDGNQEAWRVVLPLSSGGECIAPDSFSTGEITETSVAFSWAPSPTETNGYNWLIMLIGQIPGVEEPVASGTTEPGINSAFAMGLTPGTSYQVYLQTRCNGDEVSNYGAFMITTTGGGGECTAPNTFLLDEITDTSVMFSWEPSPSEVNGYNWLIMYIGQVPGVEEPVASGTTEPGINSAFASGLNPGTSYQVYLQTKCNGDEVSNYGAFMITTTGGGGECAQPSDITVSTVTDSVVYVNWVENGEATEWELEYGESGFTQGTGINVIDNDGMPGETIGGLTQGINYDVYVRAVCGFSQSEWEGPVSFVINPEPCNLPSNIIVDVITSTMVYVNWTENGEATQWEIEYGQSGFPQGEGTIIIDNDGVPGEAISGLEEGIDYDVYIRAICEFSESGWEGPVTFNTEDLGIPENSNDKLYLYPNPTTGMVNLQTKEKINSISVYNLMGQKVSFNSLNQENTSIDISNLSSGTYFIEVILNDKTIKRHKVIKK